MTQWIKAADALKAMQGDEPTNLSAEIALISRANAGLIAARAKRIVHGKIMHDDADVDPSFWWTCDDTRVHFDWMRGDFETYMGSHNDPHQVWRSDGDPEILVKLFGVTFASEDILSTLPGVIEPERLDDGKVSKADLERFHTRFVEANSGSDKSEKVFSNAVDAFFVGKTVGRSQIRDVRGEQKMGRPSKVAAIDPGDLMATPRRLS